METETIMLSGIRKTQTQHLESGKEDTEVVGERAGKWDQGGVAVTGANAVNTLCSRLKTQ